MTHIKTKKEITPEAVFSLLEDCMILSEDTRSYWEARVEKLSAQTKESLVKQLKKTVKEIKAEEDRHHNTLAEIASKADMHLKKLDTPEVKKLSAVTTSNKTELYDENELLEELKALGEI